MTQQVNLYKAEFRPARIALSVNQVLGCWFGVLVGCVLFSWVLSNELDQRRQSMSETARSQTELQVEIDRLEQTLDTRSRDTRLVRKNQDLNTLLEQGATLLDTISNQQGQLSRHKGMADILKGLASSSAKGIYLSEINIGSDSELVIRGYAISAEKVPEYLKRLGREAVFSGMHFDDLSVGKTKDSDHLMFRISSTANDIAEVDEG